MISNLMYTFFMKSKVSTAARKTEAMTGFDPVVDADYFMRNKESLLRDFSGRFVAIRNEAVVADAEDYFTLYWRLCDIYGEPVSAFIRQVRPAAFGAAEKEPAYLMLQVGETESR